MLFRRDINIRHRKVWDALNQIDEIWKSNLPDKLKRKFFQAAVESVLVYGSVSSALTTKLEKKINGAYTRMLCAILKNPGENILPRKNYMETSRQSAKTIRQQRMYFTGHCWQSKEELVGDVLLCRPSHGKQTPGR